MNIFKREDLTKAPVSQWAVSLLWMIPVVLVFGLLFVVGAFVLINKALPKDDAEMLKGIFGLTFGGSTGGVALSSGVAWVYRSLFLTKQMAQNQTVQQVTDAAQALNNPLNNPLVSGVLAGTIGTNQEGLDAILNSLPGDLAAQIRAARDGQSNSTLQSYDNSSLSQTEENSPFGLVMP